MKWYGCSKAGLVWIAFIAGLVISPGRAKADFTFGPAVNLGPVVNSSSNDYDPSISADGLSLYFSSERPGGFGGADLWVTTRVDRLGSLGAAGESRADCQCILWRLDAVHLVRWSIALFRLGSLPLPKFRNLGLRPVGDDEGNALRPVGAAGPSG